jgi:hypothetical protein
MADRRDRDDASAVVHGIDHAVVARAHTQVGPMASERPHAWRPWIAGQAVDNLGTALRTGASSCLSERRARGRTSRAWAAMSRSLTGRVRP